MMGRKTRPLIGVATPERITPAWPFLALSVWLAGGWPKRLPPRPDRALDPDVDALIIGGGDDISADLYGGKATVDVRIDPARDAAECALVRQARPRGIPVLGICRGAQMISVARGGTLHGDIYSAYRGTKKLWTPLPAKTVSIREGSALDRIIGVTKLRVNSLHHQSIDRPGEGLSISAEDTAGIVQAVEGRTGGSFLLGVQWHPEFLFYRSAHRRVFRALVEAARAYAARDRAVGDQSDRLAA